METNELCPRGINVIQELVEIGGGRSLYCQWNTIAYLTGRRDFCLMSNKMREIKLDDTNFFLNPDWNHRKIEEFLRHLPYGDINWQKPKDIVWAPLTNLSAKEWCRDASFDRKDLIVRVKNPRGYNNYPHKLCLSFNDSIDLRKLLGDKVFYCRLLAIGEDGDNYLVELDIDQGMSSWKDKLWFFMTKEQFQINFQKAELLRKEIERLYGELQKFADHDAQEIQKILTIAQKGTK